MILSHTIFSNPIIFSENSINILTIENSQLFVKFIKDFYFQTKGERGELILSNSDLILNMSKELELITDPLFLDFANKKIISKIFMDLEKNSLDEKLYLKTINIKSQVLEYLSLLINESCLPLGFNEEISITSLLKAMGLYINTEQTHLVEQLSQYMEIYEQLSLAKCFVFVNLLSYIDKKELEDLYKEVSYKKFNVLLLENKYKAKDCPWEKHILIDLDLCEVINDY